MPDRKDEKGMRDNGDFSPMRLDYATRAINRYMSKLPEAREAHAEAQAADQAKYDKVASQKGDPFEYAMKGDRIFVRDTRKGEDFRDVTGIQNEAAIREVLARGGKTPDEATAERAGIMPALKAGAMDDLLSGGPKDLEAKMVQDIDLGPGKSAAMNEEERILRSRRAPSGVSYEGS